MLNNSKPPLWVKTAVVDFQITPLSRTLPVER